MEYTFIWYKKMKINRKTIYTQPCRTKVNAKNYKEAKEKLTQFVLKKMELIIIEESEFNKIKIPFKIFDSIFKKMDELFKMFN